MIALYLFTNRHSAPQTPTDLSPLKPSRKSGVTAKHLSSSAEVLPEDALRDTSAKSFHQSFRAVHLPHVSRRCRVMDSRARRILGSRIFINRQRQENISRYGADGEETIVDRKSIRINYETTLPRVIFPHETVCLTANVSPFVYKTDAVSRGN